MNEEIFLFLHSFANRSPGLDGVILFFAQWLPYFTVIAAVIFLWVHTDKSAKAKGKEIIFVFVTGVLAWASSVLLKIIFAVNRPELVSENVLPLLVKDDYALPSGHATFFFAIATAIFLRHKRYGGWFLLLALIISLARVVAGVHFPVDVLSGFVLGGVIAYLLKNM